MIYDKRIMFTLRAAKNLAKLPEEARAEAYAQMNKLQYAVVSSAVNMILSRKEKAS